MHIIFALATTALAEDPEFVGAEAPPEEVPEEAETHLSAELGGVATSGNAMFYAINGGTSVSRKWDRNKLAGVAGINIGSAVPDTNADGLIDEAERDLGYLANARRLFAEARYDRFLSDRDSLYVLGGAFHDIFAGYDLRSHEQLGYSRLLVDTEDTEVRTELGFDYAQEFYVAGVDPRYHNVFAGRLLLGLNHAFNESVGLSDTFEVYENVLQPQDVRILNTASFSSALGSSLSLKLSHALIFDNVPVEGFGPLDQTTTVTVVATIL
ncbi:MAG TPA: DUF481 domain-containing protein [Deltaproteobacteria bacterium]|nr:DUF481 domain-containing protein [Deltaproteobacteria bacterium]